MRGEGMKIVLEVEAFQFLVIGALGVEKGSGAIEDEADGYLR